MFGHQVLRSQVDWLVCACVNPKLRPSPLASPKKQGVEQNLERMQMPPKLFPDPSHSMNEVCRHRKLQCSATGSQEKNTLYWK